MYDEKNLDWNSRLMIHALRKQIADLMSGKAYSDLQKRCDRQCSRYERELKRYATEIERLHQQIDRNRNMWFEVFQDVQNECDKRVKELLAFIEELLCALKNWEQKYEKLQKKYKSKTNEVVEARKETQDQKDLNQKLTAQINQDYKNSSIPSSQTRFRDKVPNNREKTDKKPGGQPGHEGHKRPHFDKPDEVIYLEDDPEIVNNPDYYPVDGENGLIRKQVVGIRIVPFVTEFVARVYRSRSTGKRVHAPFPNDLILETTYDESIRSLIFVMKNHLNVSEAKISEFISDFTDGVLKPSRGMINGLNKEFALKTEEERKSIFDKLVKASVLYTDFTNVRHNGKLKNVLIITDKGDVLYQFCDTKGDAAIQGTPLEFFMNTLVHDHASVFFHYGNEHQDCGVHKTRRAIGVSQNEPELTWHMKMHDLLKEMNNTRNAAEGRILSKDQISDFEKRYDAILDIADQEYNDNPPSTYYRDGINLATELRKFKKDVLLFLHNPEVDFSNNVSELLARQIKRHTVMIGTFRGNSNASGEEYCAAMSILQSAKMKGKKVMNVLNEVFNRKMPLTKTQRDEKGRFIKSKTPADEQPINSDQEATATPTMA